MVISSPSIYIFCRHYSPLGLANINTDAREYSGPPREVYGAKDFVILRKFSIVLLTSNADDWLSNRMRSYWAIIDHVWIEWLNLETEFGQNFWGWVEKIQIFQLTFCVGAVRRLPLIFILTLPRPHCLGHIPLFALTSVSPKKCGFNRPAVYCRQAFALSLRHF